jgi:hypothetical protein
MILNRLLNPLWLSAGTVFRAFREYIQIMDSNPPERCPLMEGIFIILKIVLKSLWRTCLVAEDMIKNGQERGDSNVDIF